MPLFDVQENETVINLNTGAQFRVRQSGTLDSAKYGRVSPGTQISPEAGQTIAQATRSQELAKAPKVTPEQVLQEDGAFQTGLEEGTSEFTGGLSDLASLQPGRMLIGAGRVLGAPQSGAGRAAGIGVQNFLAGIPGLGGASGPIPAAGAAFTEGLVNVLPLSGVLKGGQVLSRAGKSSKVKSVARVLDRPADPIQRASIGKKPVRAAFREAEKITDPVRTDKAASKAVEFADDITDSKIQEKALNALPQTAQTPFNEVVKAEQELSALMNKTRDPLAKSAIRKMRQEMIDASAKTSDALVKANQAAARFATGDKIFDLVNKSKDSASALTKFDALLNKEGERIIGTLGGENNIKLLRSAIQQGVRGDTLKFLVRRLLEGAFFATAIGLGANVFGRQVGRGIAP